MAKLTRKLSQVGQEALERLELPVNLAGGVARIELLGNREVYMDRHCGVLAYTTENIDVNGGSVVVRFCGRELRLRWWGGGLRVAGRDVCGSGPRPHRLLQGGLADGSLQGRYQGQHP